MWYSMLQGLGLVILLLIVAWGTKVNEDNYGKIKNGMSLREILDLLGDPTEIKNLAFERAAGSAQGIYRWVEGKKSITVTTVRDRVLAKNKSGF